MAYQRPLAAPTTGNMMEEAGAEDNRLSLDPSDPRWAKVIGAWQDGQSYDIANVKIQQISPGEFRILAFTAEPEGAAEEVGEQEAPVSPEAPAGLEPGSNPAIQRLMDEEQP